MDEFRVCFPVVERVRFVGCRNVGFYDRSIEMRTVIGRANES